MCGATVPDGYPVIRHAFGEHTRTEYIRAYDADERAIRVREEVLRAVESALDGPVSVVESD